MANYIDLDAAERRFAATRRQTAPEPRGAPAYFEYRPAPLRVTEEAPPLSVDRWTTAPAVELVMYDFGAVSVSYGIPLAGTLADLLPLAQVLRGHAPLLAASRRQVEQLVDVLQDAAVRTSISPLVETYVVFQVDELDPPQDAATLSVGHAGLIAQVLRAEARQLSDQEVQSATALSASFGPDDLTVIDADSALVADRDAADVRAVIEFANAQLLEMRFLDQQLDDALERSYELLSRQRWGRRARWSFYDPDLRRVAQLELDAAVLFERVTNALKLIGEQYLTRIYGFLSRRFHLAEWDVSITRKLQTLESIYTKMADRAATRRMELLEWIIIGLIAISIIISLPVLGGH